MIKRMPWMSQRRAKLKRMKKSSPHSMLVGCISQRSSLPKTACRMGVASHVIVRFASYVCRCRYQPMYKIIWMVLIADILISHVMNSHTHTHTHDAMAVKTESTLMTRWENKRKNSAPAPVFFPPFIFCFFSLLFLSHAVLFTIFPFFCRVLLNFPVIDHACIPLPLPSLTLCVYVMHFVYAYALFSFLFSFHI